MTGKENQNSAKEKFAKDMQEALMESYRANKHESLRSISKHTLGSIPDAFGVIVSPESHAKDASEMMRMQLGVAVMAKDIIMATDSEEHAKAIFDEATPSQLGTIFSLAMLGMCCIFYERAMTKITMEHIQEEIQKVDDMRNGINN